MLLKTLAALSIFWSANLLFSPSLSANTHLDQHTESPLPTTLSKIDREIQLLETELNNYRSNAFKEEMQAQPYMLDSWHRFAKGIENHEDDEKQILAIKERLKKLYEKKAATETPMPQSR